MSQPKYKRVLLKLSGEVLAGGASFGIDGTQVKSLAAELAEVHRAGVELGDGDWRGQLLPGHPRRRARWTA
jgi:uridylate kinase